MATLDLEGFKKSIVDVVRTKMQELDWKSVGKIVEDANDHKDYSEEYCNQLISYAVTAIIVRESRLEDQRRFKLGV